MNNKILLAIGLGLGYYLLNQKKERLYFVPNVGNVKESELFRYGYIEQPFGSGKYYTQAQINAAAIQAGAAPGSTIDPNSQTFNTILTILNGLTSLVPIVQTIVTAANRPQKIQEILNKYTSTVSSYYNPSFPYSKTMLKSFSNEQLAYILDNGTLQNVSGVSSRKLKNSRECNNGQYSTATAQGTCSYNGGLKKGVKNIAKSKKRNQLNLFDSVNSVSDPYKEFKKDCAKKHGLERSFRGEEYKLSAIHLSKEEQDKYIDDWRGFLRKNGIKYRTFNTKDCFLTYTKHPLKKK